MIVLNIYLHIVDFISTVTKELQYYTCMFYLSLKMDN